MARPGKASISPEADFLTFCCREEAARDWAGVTRRAQAVRDWRDTVELASRHRVCPLLLPVLGRLARQGAIPGWVTDEMERRATADLAQVMRLRAALREMLAAFHQQQIQVMVLKGAALGSLLYGDPALRPSNDIDLLCREADFQRAHQMLVSLGYQPGEDSTLPLRRAPLETYFERHFYHPDGTVVVELHVDSIKLGARPNHREAIWQMAKTIELEGEPALALAPEDQVVMLSIHLHRHGFNRLLWFIDIDLLVRRYGDLMDWRRIVDEARAEGAGISVWYTFHLLDRMLGTPVPEEVMGSLKPHLFTRWPLSWLWPEAEVLDLRGRTRRRAVQFSVLESWRGTLPSLLLMGRRKEKVGILLRRLWSFRPFSG